MISSIKEHSYNNDFRSLDLTRVDISEDVASWRNEWHFKKHIFLKPMFTSIFLCVRIYLINLIIFSTRSFKFKVVLKTLLSRTRIVFCIFDMSVLRVLGYGIGMGTVSFCFLLRVLYWWVVLIFGLFFVCWVLE
jgi:hypothetical protein